MDLKEVPDFALAPDTNLAPPRAQHPAMPGKPGKKNGLDKRNPQSYAKPCN